MLHAFIPDLEQGGQVNLHQGGANIPVPITPRWCKHTCPRNTKTVQRSLSPMHQLLGEFVDDAFDLGELDCLELLVA